MSRAFTISRYAPAGRAPSWKVEGRAPDGSKVRRFFPVKTAAEAFAHDANSEIRSVGWQAMGLADDQRIEAARCYEELSSSGRSLTEAVRFYLKHLAETERSVTVAEAVTELLEAKSGKGLSSRHRINLKYFLTPLSAQFGDRKVSTVNRREIESWLNSRGLHPTSYKSTLTHLSLFFNHCMKAGTASGNPAKDITAPKAPPEEVGILTPKALRSLITITREHHPDMLASMLIQAFAGLRRAEVQRLDWREVKLADGHIEVTAKKSKTRNRRVIDISPNLAAFLAPLRADSGLVAPACFNHCFKEIRSKVIKEKQAFPRNALRHSFVTYRLASTGDEKRTALESGDLVETLHEHYKGLVNEKTAAEWWSILPTDAKGGNIVTMSVPAKVISTVDGKAKRG
jgi:site-specific recombinase XerC